MTAAMISFAADQAHVNYSTYSQLAFDREVYDNGGYFDAGSPGVFTIPSGVSLVQVGATVTPSGVTAGSGYELEVRKGGTEQFDGACRSAGVGSTNGAMRINISSGPIPVVEGDTFTLHIRLTGDSDSNVVKAATNFWIQSA